MVPKVSVIMPSFNVSAYIRECMESVINQNLKDIEMICVDAGSTDGTLDILREYEKNDSRIKLLISEKKSYGHQMNMGILAASGEYIGIVETDDYILPEMYEELYDIAKGNNADFVKSDFWRFARHGGKEDLKYTKLSLKQELYNKVVDVSSDIEYFVFPINTWSGIYKTSFLKQNKIEHNESPGASFQDNGFWFQTFMYGRRAYFVNKAYYRNRRDNPGSSVFDDSKQYCICDEYRYIYSLLKNDPSRYESMKKMYIYACYKAYKWMLDKIQIDRKREFLKRFSKDFLELEKEGYLCREAFNDVDWNIIQVIMADPASYYEINITNEKKLEEELKKYPCIIIYGAGMIGRRFYEGIKNHPQINHVVCFAVTDMADNFSEYEGICVEEIHTLGQYLDKAALVIASTSAYHDDMEKNARSLGFKHIYKVPNV